MGVTAGAIGSAIGFSGTAATVAGGTALAVGSTAAAVGVSSLLAPKAPKAPTPVPMPDLAANPAQAIQTSAQQNFRTGRASTVLTNNADTGDRLGP